MSSSGASVTLWVKSEPCTFGAIPAPPHTRLSLHNIRKIVDYAKSKGKPGYPKLSYSVWRHISQNKLQLPPDFTWVYFSSYHAIAEELSPEQKLDLDKKLQACSSNQELESVRNYVSVNTLKFVLFLYIQHLSKTSLRASLVSANEEWPMRSRSPELDGGRSTPSGGKGLDEHSHTNFVLSNLTDMLELLVDKDMQGGADPSDNQISLDGVEALGFLIAGSTDKLRSVKPLQDVVATQSLQEKAGYSKVHMETSRSSRGVKLVISRHYSIRTLSSWIRSNLSHNPFGISSCISTGRRLSWPLAGEDREAKLDSKRGKIATNSHLIPKDAPKGNKLIVMSQVCKQTIARNSSTLEGASVTIHRCHHTFVYLLSPLRSVSVEKCRNSTIVLGAVESTIHLNHCQNCIVITASRRVIVSGCHQCVLHLLTPTNPLMLNNNSDVILAPYHTHYPLLEQHMATVGLRPRPNLWDKPIYMGTDASDVPGFKLMQPADCLPFTVPFDMDGPTQSIPGGLPTAFQQAWEERDLNIKNWQAYVKNSALNKDQRHQFRSLVESQFQEWLQNMGYNRQLDDLAIGQGAK